MCTDKCMLDEAVRYLDTSSEIPLDRMLSCMQSTDIEVLGIAAELLTNARYWPRIQPALDADRLFAFLTQYYERCFREDPDTEWADTRYGVARNIVSWFHAVPQGEDVNAQDWLVRLKDWMARVYIDSDENIRGAITAGALEHILEEPRWRSFFDDWRQDAVRHDSYEKAMEWAEAHER